MLSRPLQASRCACTCAGRSFATEASNIPLPTRPPVSPYSIDPPPPSVPPSLRQTLGIKQSDLDASRFGRLGTHESLDNVPSELADTLREILGSFRAPIRYAVGYGSGVFKQASYASNAQPMLDLILAVSHPTHWHDINRQQHPSHYSLLARMLGSTFIGWAQERLGAGVWFNVDALVKGRRIKYGVVSVDTMCSDLLDWKTLYIAGRMQKPTAVLKDNARISLANQVNLLSALRTALLLLPEEFHETQLFETITGLSYMGDPRMRMAENPDKVRNIVSAQRELFEKLYKPLMSSATMHRKTDGSCTQSLAPTARADIARKLPITLRERLKTTYSSTFSGHEGTNGDTEKARLLAGSSEKEIWQKVVQDSNFEANIKEQLRLIVGKAASRQSMKGALSVGPVRGIKYVWPKVKKRFGGSK